MVCVPINIGPLEMMKQKLLKLACDMNTGGGCRWAEQVLQLLLKEDEGNIELRRQLARTYALMGRQDLAITQAQICADLARMKNIEFPPAHTLVETHMTEAKARNGEGKIAEEVILSRTFTKSLGKIVQQSLAELTTPPVFMQDPRYEDFEKRRRQLSQSYDRKMLLEARVFNSWEAHIEHAFAAVEFDGLYTELGVYKGGMINFMAARLPEITFHGFDSFEGLPETWNKYPVGHLSLNGEMPEVLPNVQLYKGWFADTLPAFVANHDEPAAFIHIDCDIYSATQTILSEFHDLIVPGTVIVFDEYYYDEVRAFYEYIEREKREFTYLSYRIVNADVYPKDMNVDSVAVKITR